MNEYKTSEQHYNDFYKNHNYLKDIEKILSSANARGINDVFIAHIAAREIFYNENKTILDNYKAPGIFKKLSSNKKTITQEEFLYNIDTKLLSKIFECSNELSKIYSLRIDEDEVDKIDSVILIDNYEKLFVSQFIIEQELWSKIVLNDLFVSKNENKSSIISNLKMLYHDVSYRTNQDYIKTYECFYAPVEFGSVSKEYEIFNYDSIFEDPYYPISIDEIIGRKHNLNKLKLENKLILRKEYKIKGLANLIYACLTMNSVKKLSKNQLNTLKTLINNSVEPEEITLNCKNEIINLPIERFITKEKVDIIILLFYYLDQFLKAFCHNRRNNRINITKISNYFNDYLYKFENEIIHKGLSGSSVKKKLESYSNEFSNKKDVTKKLGLAPHSIEEILFNKSDNIDEYLKNYNS